MGKLYVCKEEGCLNKEINNGNTCCYSCKAQDCDFRCNNILTECPSILLIDESKLKEHELKILPEYYIEVLSGRKKFEIRLNDRDFKVGDIVKLREFENNEYTGNFIKGRITYILHGGQFGLQEGYCIFSLSIFSYGNRNF